jgi:hypothetical protein
MDEQGEILENLIARAERRIDVQIAADEALDVKALGVIAALLAVIALNIAANDSLASWWLVPTIALGIASFLLGWSIWPRRYDTGPDIEDFYAREKDSSANDARRQMLSELIEAEKFNRRVFPRKGAVLKVAVAIGAAGIAGSVVSVVSGYT